MCGIAGLLGDVDRDLLERMTDRLAHRGPDGRGVLQGKGWGFGHRRLAIIDLDGGAQPMQCHEGELAITFNGEIYNFIELRAQLERRGHRFTTSSDTEVILAGYREWGDAVVEHLVGMFAFAIWDGVAQRALLARDHVGVKPLYYAVRDTTRRSGPAFVGICDDVGVTHEIAAPALAFGSEPKAVLGCAWIDREVDPVALDAYVDLLYVPPPRSIFAGVWQLPPGHTLVWARGRLTLRRYWDALPTIDQSHDERTWAEIFEPVLRDAIVLQTRSDVPYGAFLSGGLDSSTIVAVLAEHGHGAVETFCVGYGVEGRSYDERAMARLVAQHFATNHHEVVLDLDVLGGLEAMVCGFDEPYGSPTALLTSALSKFTRGSVTVALAGDGGDELFGGYPRYLGMALAEHASRLPSTLLTGIRSAIAGPEAAVARSYRRWARQFLAALPLAPAERYAAWVGYTAASDRDAMYTAEFRAQVAKAGRVAPVRTSFECPPNGDVVERAAYADLHGFLPENVLRGSDRMSMAHGLELRVPLCDPRLVELAMQVPSRQRIGALASKRILRRIAGKLLPREILARKKLGFNAPLGAWLRRDLDRMVAEWLAPDVVRRRGWFAPAAIARFVEEHRARHRDHGLRIWSLIVLEQWARTYLDA